jgi:hypothetical protein
VSGGHLGWELNGPPTLGKKKDNNQLETLLNDRASTRPVCPELDFRAKLDCEVDVRRRWRAAENLGGRAGGVVGGAMRR